MEADLRFDHPVVAAPYDTMLIDLYRHLTDGLRQTLRAVVDFPLPDAARHQTPEHAAIVAAIAAGDAEAAEPPPPCAWTGRGRTRKQPPRDLLSGGLLTPWCVREQARRPGGKAAA